MHKIILSTLLLTSLSFAESGYSFLGANTSYIDYNNVSSPSLGLKYGLQRGMWRTSINLDYASSGSDKLTSLIIQVDRGILKNITKDIPFKPHVGFSTGILHYNDTGYGIGLNTGITYLLNDDIDLDLSYRLLSTSNVENVGSINSLNLSLHYFY